VEGGMVGLKFLAASALAVAMLGLLTVRGGSRRATVLSDVAVSTSSFPSYYGAPTSAPARNFQYPSMSSGSAPSLAGCGGVVVSGPCMVPGGGVAAMAAPSVYLPSYYGAPYGAPYYSGAGMNTFQAPTVWQGDHVVSGGQPEWASEDAAQHALNLANWRIKLLQAKLEQAKLASKVMNVAAPGTYENEEDEYKTKTASQLKQIKNGLVSLASSTSDAISSLADKVKHIKGPSKTKHR